MGLRDFIDSFRNTVKRGDYKYVRRGDGWRVYVLDTTKTSYGPIESEIGGMPVVSLFNTFYDCKNLTVAPEIPSSVTIMYGTFQNCTSLTDVSKVVIPEGVTSIDSAFRCCRSLADLTGLKIQEGVKDMNGTFAYCSSLTDVSNLIIPSTVTEMYGTFTDCTSLVKPPKELPPNVERSFSPQDDGYVVKIFGNCPSLLLTDEQNHNHLYAEEYSPIRENGPEWEVIRKGDYNYHRCINHTPAHWWVVAADETKTSYGPIESEIDGIPVTHMYKTFQFCEKLTVAPKIPDSVTDMYETFWGCKKLKTAPEIPSGVTDMTRTFDGCTSLTTAPKIPDSVKYMDGTFCDCKLLTTTPIIPNSVIDMHKTFYNCENLTVTPKIPNGVIDIYDAFSGCKNLTTAPEIPDSVKHKNNVYYGCNFNKTIADQVLSGDEKLSVPSGTDDKNHDDHDDI